MDTFKCSKKTSINTCWGVVYHNRLHGNRLELPSRSPTLNYTIVCHFFQNWIITLAGVSNRLMKRPSASKKYTRPVYMHIADTRPCFQAVYYTYLDAYYRGGDNNVFL